MSYSMSTEAQNKLKEIVLKKKSLSEAQGEVLKVQASVHGQNSETQGTGLFTFIFMRN